MIKSETSRKGKQTASGTTEDSRPEKKAKDGEEPRPAGGNRRVRAGQVDEPSRGGKDESTHICQLINCSKLAELSFSICPLTPKCGASLLPPSFPPSHRCSHCEPACRAVPPNPPSEYSSAGFA